MIKKELLETARPVRDGLAAIKDVVVAVVPSDPAEDKRLTEAAEALRRQEHPTRREDRPPNPRKAEDALARDLGLEGNEGLGVFE